ncbi:MAG: Elongation factor Ts [Candidatus Roizmanbacteria bacterium GW2011_GWA2_36_23]|uniref:Elongation factor Ts n=1 Tax=Candidatus Roizmanbacteria bacterium GW2011_GWA2_36_23 TaxID=1618480 RepID=A0A0G0E4I3_9BACT|nr:MAG: Elongation factor Ts [Candidatus Roizmanbacteria bacterium GW2011_GWA2_36_23]
MLDIEKLKQLREETGISFSLCKKALEETKNNIAEAKKILTQWGTEKIRDKAQRSTSQGAIFSYVHHNKKVAAMVELMCETDFVAGNNDFIKLGQELAMQIASLKAVTTEELLHQDYIREPAKKIEDLLKDAVMKFGENIKIGRIFRRELGIQ